MFCHLTPLRSATLLLTLFVFLLSTADAFLESCYEEHPKNMMISVQERLLEEGFDPGPTDGQWGIKTRKAVANFQKSVGIRNAEMLNGVLNADTLRALLGEWFRPEEYGLTPKKDLPPNIFDDYCK